MDFAEITRLDVNDMAGMLRRFPEQFTKPLAYPHGTLRFPRGLKRAALAGLGGSALPGDIVNALLPSLNPPTAPIEIIREYDLPGHLGTDTLLFVASFSGNTEETLSAYAQGRARGLPMCVVTRGGKLAAYAERDGVPLCRIDEPLPVFQPRFGYGYFYAHILRALAAADLVAPVDDHLRAVAAALTAYNPVPRAESTAQALVNRIPLLYARSPLGAALARILKIKFNENAKVPAFYNAIPELNHNEMVGFTNTLGAPFTAVLLRDGDDHPRNAVRFDALAAVLAEKGVGVYTYELDGGPLWERIFRAQYVFDWATYYLACAYGYDPVPVVMVEGFKKAIEG